jgi:hypothetical protein
MQNRNYTINHTHSFLVFEAPFVVFLFHLPLSSSSSSWEKEDKVGFIINIRSVKKIMETPRDTVSYVYKKSVVQLPLCADAVAFRPYLDHHPPSSSTSALLATATYQLDQSTGKRQGGLFFFRCYQTKDDVDDEAKEEDGGEKEGKEKKERRHDGLEMKQEVTWRDTPGIFDIQWSRSNPNLIGISDANGRINILSVINATEENHDIVISLSSSSSCSSSSSSDETTPLSLSLEWNDRIQAHLITEPRIVSSYSDGSIAVWQVVPSSSSLSLLRRLPKGNFEPSSSSSSCSSCSSSSTPSSTSCSSFFFLFPSSSSSSTSPSLTSAHTKSA